MLIFVLNIFFKGIWTQTTTKSFSAINGRPLPKYWGGGGGDPSVASQEWTCVKSRADAIDVAMSDSFMTPYLRAHREMARESCGTGQREGFRFDRPVARLAEKKVHTGV